MRTACLLLPLLLLVTVLSAPCRAGNKELMEKWAAKKQYVRDQILDELRKQGELPRNGTVHFEARVKTGADGKMTTFVIDSVEVFENTPAAPGGKNADALSAAPKGGAEKIREESIDFAETAPNAGVAGKLGGKKRKVQVHGRLSEGVLDIPGTATIVEDIVLRDGQPGVRENSPVEKKGQKGTEESGTHEVGDKKTEKSWWKIW